MKHRLLSHICMILLFASLTARGENFADSSLAAALSSSPKEVAGMQCLRIYADDKGESHFSNLEISMSDAPPPLSVGIQMSARMTTRDIRFLTIPAGSSTDWHPAPARQFVISLDKTVEVEVSDGERRRVPPASVMLVEDTWGKGHRTRSLGDHAGTVIFVPLTDDAPR